MSILRSHELIERNWKLNGKLTSRSRDNLPNPLMDDENPYVPTNMRLSGICSTYSILAAATTEDNAP